MGWLRAHHEIIALFISAATLIVWIAYLQVFLASYLRQRKAAILITTGQGRGPDAHCLVTNMSAGPVYIHALVATLEGPGGRRACPITELDGEEREAPSELQLWTRQGPLESGDIRDMGSMRALIDHALAAREPGEPRLQPGTDLRTLEIRVLALHGSDGLPVAARRRFDLGREGGTLTINPQGYAAEQIRSRHERKRLARELSDGWLSGQSGRPARHDPDPGATDGAPRS